MTKPLVKTDSIAILQDPQFRPSERSTIAGDKDDITDVPAASKNTIVGESTRAVVAVDVALRRRRIVLGTIAIVAAIVASTRFFHHGYEIRQYDKSKLDAAQQKDILDTYNSRSGSIATAFSKPIELFIAACVQVILLRFVSSALLRNEPSWKAVYSALALSAGVGYLINNGFSSLNVQLVDLEIHSVIVASDLSLDDTVDTTSSHWESRVTSVKHTVPESQPRNPIQNTVLRNLVQSRAVRPPTLCHPDGYISIFNPVSLDTVDYAFPQRDWMKQLLTEAPTPRTMPFLLNPSNKSANSGLKSDDLPMNASIASDLTLYAVRLFSDFTPLTCSLLDPLYKEKVSEVQHNMSAAVRFGILPPSLSTSNDDQKKWFLKNVGPYLTSAFSETKNMKMTDIPMNFSHVDIAPSISFDAVTFDIDVAANFYTYGTNKTTGARYMRQGYDIETIADGNFSCDPWPALCTFKKRGPTVSSVVVTGSSYYDVPAQIQAFSICLNENGTELLGAKIPNYPNYVQIQPCARRSNTSMLLLSVGKRLVAERLKTFDSSASDTAENVRKIYSFTIGRLSWTTTDISKDFGVTCNVTSEEKCNGLVLDLDQASPTSAPQKLVVSAHALPMNALQPPQVNNLFLDNAYRQRPLTLVFVNEPTVQESLETGAYEAVVGDILLPHNIHTSTRSLGDVNERELCDVQEERVQRVLDNHMYIEHPLQATYTAAVFFLLQKAVVKDVIPATESRMNTTILAFDGNTQNSALVVSIPWTNALLTELGCVILFIGVAASIAWATVVRSSTTRVNGLTGITNAEVMVRTKLDETTFPPLLLHRHVTLTSDTSVERRELDSFVISSLSLQLLDTDKSATVDRGTEDSTDSSLSVPV